MKKFLLAVLIVLAIVAISLFLLRQISGWNDGMASARSEIHAAVLDQKVYVAGGIGLFRVLDSCEYYDPADQEWNPCAPLPRPLHHVAMAADGNQVFASGGYVALPFEQDTDATLFALDPESDRWTELSKLPNPIGQHAMVYLDGKLYLVGGQNGAEDLATLWAYDLAQDEWAEMAAMPTPRHSHAIAVDDGKLFVTGGRSAALGTEIAKVEAYDFASNNWENLPDMPTGRGGHGAFVRSGKLHVFGGESLADGKVLSDHHILDLKSGAWSEGAKMTKPRHGFAVGDDGNSSHISIIGGGAHPGFQTIYSVTGTTQTLDE